MNNSKSLRQLDTVTFKVKFLPVTNTKGARVSVKNLYNDQRAIFPFNYNFREISAQFRDHIQETAPEFILINQFWDGYTFFITYSFEETARYKLAAGSSIYTY